MIGVSKLYCGTVEPSDVLRYGSKSSQLPAHLLQFSNDKKPVVVWNVTQRCNLHCAHCYSHSQNKDYRNELNTTEGLGLLADLADFGVPVVLFSGGEPLLRSDLPELIERARVLGMRTVISTNGTLLSDDMAGRFRDAGLSYIGVSLDGLRANNDRFRGVNGAFDQAFKGIQAAKNSGIKVGLRFTMSRRNVTDIEAIFDLIEQEEIPRICFYHLVYSGRASKLIADDLTHAESRSVLDYIITRTMKLHKQGRPVEVLTVDNHCDGPYIYMRMKTENPGRAKAVYKLLQMNGGNNSGIGIGCVSWDGTVYPDQFWRNKPLGSIRKQPFSEIWNNSDLPLLSQLRNRSEYIKGRCACCRWFSICNGNLRARAESQSGDVWGDDPACYLSDKEIAL